VTKKTPAPRRAGTATKAEVISLLAELERLNPKRCLELVAELREDVARFERRRSALPNKP
jgi:hypothetical protein